MAQSGVTINILSNVRDAVRGVDDVVEAVEDVEARLHDLTKEGDTAADRMEADFRSVAKAADKTSDELKDAFRSAYKSVRADSDAATKDVSQGLSTVKDEAKSSGKEAAASFSGGFDDVADFVQEVIANAFEGFGPAGAAAGIAVAAIIGTILSNAQAAQEKLAETRERAVDMAETLYENQGRLPIADRVSELLEYLGSERLARNPFESIADGFVDMGTNIDEVREAAQNAGIPLQEMVRALSGADLGDAQDMLSKVNDEIGRLDRASSGVDLSKWQAQRDVLSNVKKQLEGVVTQSELARDLYNSTEFLNTQKIEELSEAWQNAAADAGEYFSETEEGATSFDWSSYLRNAEETIAAADELKARIVGMPSDIKAEAERIFSQQGAVAANEYAKAYESASAQDKSRFINAASANGAAAGAAQANALKSAFGTPVLGAVVRIDRIEDGLWRNYKPAVKTAQISVSGNPVYRQGGRFLE